MNENKLVLLTISDLLTSTTSAKPPYAFFIPAYQRGYRWTTRQVEDLLNDIFEFHNNNKNGEYYCLQPVVVKPRGEDWEVIDGQQRLTTIYLVLKYFNDRVMEKYRKRLYTLAYETRPQSQTYLDQLDTTHRNENVDYFHIYQAYETIERWFDPRQNLVNDIESTLLNLTKIIWYEVNGQTDSIDIFTRLNSGKIPLDNAELIKALFLLRNNFDGNDSTKDLRQLEIASEWDRIEATLRDEEFWGFITNKSGRDQYENRIGLIFDLICGKESYHDKDYTFREYYRQFEETKNAEKSWREVKNYFLTFQEWYNDHEFFHLIGFLVTVEEDIAELKKGAIDRTKSEFKKFLKDKIRACVPLRITELEYSSNKERKLIKKVLLLFNIVSIINNRKGNYKFQFGRYKAENWDLEHIHAVRSEIPEGAVPQRNWLDEILTYTDKEDLKERIENWLNATQKTRPEPFEILYEDVVKIYSGENENDEINDISNLTLLDSGTNRGYKNSVFAVKRSKIIEKDQTGTFIPLCTKNTFLKYYSHSVDQMTLWGHDDRKSYLDAIVTTLNEYLKEEKND
jgi:uncharacterized protein with ParB-like and HNH nuclease domain